MCLQKVHKKQAWFKRTESFFCTMLEIEYCKVKVQSVSELACFWKAPELCASLYCVWKRSRPTSSSPTNTRPCWTRWRRTDTSWTPRPTSEATSRPSSQGSSGLGPLKTNYFLLFIWNQICLEGTSMTHHQGEFCSLLHIPATPFSWNLSWHGSSALHLRHVRCFRNYRDTRTP